VSIQYRIDVDRHLVLTRIAGEVSAADVAAYYAELRADPQYSPAYSILNDLTGATPIGIVGASVRAMAAESPVAPGARLALVVGNDLHFGLARMLQVYAEGRDVQVEVFKDHAKAREWLQRIPPTEG
jgi:hypothetical protein